MKKILGFLLLAALNLHAEPLVVHEWGTFTVLQVENGTTVPGINSDDEPVPSFVHRVGNLIRSSQSVRAASSRFPGIVVAGKSFPLPRCHPDVRMRLETPVVYFYPPPGAEPVVDVEVAFPAGWISEFYPDAVATTPGLGEGRILPEATGRLVWTGLKIGGREDGPPTDSPVWLVPRAVEASSVRTPAGEVERYLFYRGVANLEAPVRVKREGGRLKLSGETRVAWLADFRGDGTAAFRRAGAEMPAEFSGYSRENRDLLRKEMRDELVAEGLFPKEADVMLETWKDSYFQSRGLRLFYMVPRPWTDRHLPLTVSPAADVTRAMIGRVELVTPGQRRTLERLVKLDAVNPADLPGGYYLLGRFANALLADEHRRRPTEGTLRWMNALQLGGE